MSDRGQGYYEMLQSVGKMPHEFADAPAPSKYFVEQAHREQTRRYNDQLDSNGTSKSLDVGE